MQKIFQLKLSKIKPKILQFVIISQPMQQDRFKINFQNFVFELLFKTEYCLEMTATDVMSQRRYHNKNVEFKKIPKASIVAALQDKNPKELLCKISEEYEEKLEEKDELSPILGKKCLRVQFSVTLEYIQSFSECTMLYEIDNPSKLDAVIPKRLDKETVKEAKRQIAEIEAAMPTGEQSPQEMFQIHEVANLYLNYDHLEGQRIIIASGVYFIVALIAWISYIEFKEFFVVVLTGIIGLIVYFRSQKHLIKKIELKRGTYKINVSGQLTVQNYSQNPHDSFILHAQLSSWFQSKKLKIYINSMNSYAYPFSGTFLIESQKEQEVSIKIQKNTKFYPVTLGNVVITVDKVSHFVSLK